MGEGDRPCAPENTATQLVSNEKQRGRGRKPPRTAPELKSPGLPSPKAGEVGGVSDAEARVSIGATNTAMGSLA